LCQLKRDAFLVNTLLKDEDNQHIIPPVKV